MDARALFRPEHRLNQAAEFKAVFDHRRVLREGSFDLHYLPQQLGSARLGVVIPKRFARRAVLRNTFKRMAREAFRLQRVSMPHCDLVLRLARPIGPVTPSSPREPWRKTMERLFARLAP